MLKFAASLLIGEVVVGVSEVGMCVCPFSVGRAVVGFCVFGDVTGAEVVRAIVTQTDASKKYFL